MMWSQDISVRDLAIAMQAVEPKLRPLQLPGFEGSPETWNRHKLGLDCDEVYPDIFIGNGITVRDKQYLKELRITHVVNCAEGRHKDSVNVNAWYYQDANIKYLGLPLEDMPSANIQDYFHCAAHFIDCALYNGGRVFVNCIAGVSRSATIVMAFLMLRRKMSGVEAVQVVRRARDVWPNVGFLRKLADLHNQLRRQRCPQKSQFYVPAPYASIGSPCAQP